MAYGNDYSTGHLLIAIIIAGIIGMFVGGGICKITGGSDIEANWYDEKQKVITYDNQLHQLVPVQVVVKSVSYEKEEVKK